jgi:hypothetical protein
MDVTLSNATDSESFLPQVAGGYCDSQHRQEVENFFSGRSTKYTGGPRILTQVLSGIDLPVAYKNAQEASRGSPPTDTRRILI